ncbi:hypothetical protein HK099_001441 [Clydaea vesicula]|uniref:Alcohol dehydrogenase-like C-terminal domain-containing protein n=1 Tax=Clydaea vesicula TaxID=447962 RepID=A0AAD5U535_9FUNG|nr:hypothetical protein HK099_001441 [Clydaea vesicula]
MKNGKFNLHCKSNNLVGMSSISSYYSFHIGQPKKGETLFVGFAARGVVQVVGQTGKKVGLRVVGSVSSNEKVKFLKKKLGFDGAINIKKEQLDAVLCQMNNHGRIPLCGMVSQYENNEFGVKNVMFIISDRNDLYPEFLDYMSKNGKDFHYEINVVEGIESAPNALIGYSKLKMLANC